MGTPSPFEVSRLIGNNLNASFKRANDESTIESIITQASASGDPKVLENSIGQILSQVSPERQGPAIQYLQQVYQNVQAKQQQQRQRNQAIEAGISPDLPPAVQAAQLKEKAKSARLQDIYGTSQMPGPGAAPAPGQPANLQNISQDVLIQRTGHPDREVYEPAKAELKRRLATEKQEKTDIREQKKETLPYKVELVKKADAARKGIQNKTQLLEIIDRGELDDPTFATVAEHLPWKLGKRLLSKDTVEYKAGLIEEFSDLRNLFPGQVRVKEIQLLEEKIADIYLTDSQKKSILKSRINALQADIIREEAAIEVDEKYPNLGLLAYQKKVNELTDKKLSGLFNRILDEQQAIIKDAENLKKTPLNYDDPEARQILDQLMKEAGGDRGKARELAKKKGYTIGK